MNTPPKPLPPTARDLCIQLLQDLVCQEEQGSAVVGVLPDGYDLAAVQARLDDHGLSVYPEQTTPRKIGVDSGKEGVFTDLKSLLARKNWLNANQPFFLVDSGYDSQDATAPMPSGVAGYKAAKALFSLLSACADHTAPLGTLIFLKKAGAKLEVTLNYTWDDVLALGECDILAGFLQAPHIDQKKAIVGAVLLEMFAGEKRIALADLLRRRDDFVARVKSGFDMYMAEFSFEKIRAEVEKEGLETTIRLNKVLSDIQNQILAVPVAVVLAAGNMEATAGFSVKNFVIWLGVLLLACFMGMLLRNQRDTLNALGEEIDAKQARIAEQSTALKEKFGLHFASLKIRECRQKTMMSSLWWLILAALVITTLVMVWMSWGGQMSECLKAWADSRSAPSKL